MKNVIAVIFSCIGLISCSGGGSSAPPPNSPPLASISVSNSVGHAPLVLTFDASGSSDSDGNITNYSWDFGDGFTSQGSQVEHIFGDLGDFTVRLTVTDNSGASSSTQTVINVHAQAAGFYLGSLNSTVTGQVQDIEVHIGSNYKLFGLGFPPSCSFSTSYSGTMEVDDTSGSSILLADTGDPFCIFPDGTTIGDVNISANIDARNSIAAIYDGVGDQGTISLTYVPELSDRTASLTNISGIWSYSDGLGFTETMTIQPDGQFAASTSDGCNYSGTFSVLDSRLNEYEIIYDLSCPPGVSEAGDGQRVGNAFIDDFFFAEEWLEWNVIFQEGPLAGRMGGGALSRPLSSAAATVTEAPSEKIQPRKRRSPVQPVR